MFYKKINTNDNKECFEFLTKHFEYDTTNTWNGCKSIANKVKVWNLPVDSTDALQALEEDDYLSINMCIEEWEKLHPQYRAGFNGRSGGYLVLYAKDHNGHVFMDDELSPVHYDNYDNWKNAIQEIWGSLKAYHPSLLKQVKIVQEFDKLCDDLLSILIDLIKEMHTRHDNTFEWHALKRHEQYNYDTLEDYKYHKEYMLQKGYRVWEESENELWIEFEMNESEEGSVTITK